MDNSTIMNMLILTVVCVVMVIVIKMMASSKDDSNGPKQMKKTQTEDGVDKAVAALRRYASAHEFGFVAPLTVACGEKTAELSALIVTYNGVIGVRCIGRNGEVFANPGDKEWLWVAGEHRETFENPVDACAADVRVLRDILAKAGLRGVKVECHSVFTSPKVSLAVPKSIPTWRTARDFTAQLSADKYMEDTGIDKNAVLAALNEAAK